MTAPPARRIRGGWIIVGAVVWLILASSISLEHGRQGTAQWGGITALGVIALVLLGLMLKGAGRTIRMGVRVLRRHVRNRR